MARTTFHEGTNQIEETVLVQIAKQLAALTCERFPELHLEDKLEDIEERYGKKSLLAYYRRRGKVTVHFKVN